MTRLWAHMRRLWPRWTLLPAAPFVLYGTLRIAFGDFRWELFAAVFIGVFLAYWNERTKRLLTVMYPLLLVGILYDAMGPIQNVGLSEETVHVCDLHAAERAVFGVGSGDARVTLPDYFRYDTSAVLHVLSAIPYGTFIFAIIGYGIYLYFRDIRALSRYAWTFLILNILGFATYHIYPAAPPWYVHDHGCAVDLTTEASAGAKLLQIDQWMGFGFFEGFYGRSNDVFGAVPSLHVAYAVLILLAVWPHHGWLGRTVAAVYFVLMTFGAIYLAHHWLIDACLGIVYCVVVYAVVGQVQNRLRPPRSGPDALPDERPA